jgi:hypothetical protein
LLDDSSKHEFGVEGGKMAAVGLRRADERYRTGGSDRAFNIPAFWEA